MSKCKELEEPYGTFVTTKMAEKIVPKPQIKQINNKIAKPDGFWSQCVRVQHYYIVKLEEPYATFVTDNN